MSLFTSSHFASVAAMGADWREVSKSILAQIEEAPSLDKDFNLGFLYISDHLVDDATSILNLFKSVLGIEHWVGCVGLGICSVGQSFVDVPAVSVLLGRFADDEFCVFPPVNLDLDGGRGSSLDLWSKEHDPLLVLTHGNSAFSKEWETSLKGLEVLSRGFVSGGFSSSRKEHIQFADSCVGGGLSGVVFSSTVKVASALSQGCTPVGALHTITSGDEYEVRELDGEKALEVFEQDLRALASKKAIQTLSTSYLTSGEDIQEQDIPDIVHDVFKGQIYTAFPVRESDYSGDYLVRGIRGLEDDGSIIVGREVSLGEKMTFVYRDDKTMKEDLSRQLLQLRDRVIKETGVFEPKGAIYISCIARMGDRTQDLAHADDEMVLVRDIIGDVPLTGFYSSGEISNARLYGFTGVLLLFL